MEQINEDYVSFETAKLLKEKGFDGVVSAHYNNLGGVIMGTNPISKNTVKCPTLQMAMKWLREVHKIFIDVDYDSDEFKDSPYFSLIINMNTNDYFKGYGLPQEKSTYEEACEAAIKYCLEKLI